MPISHTKVSGISDSLDTSLVRPSDWNADHAVSGQGGLPSGTSFPGSPTTDDLFYRTDLDLLFFYDGTRWLSSTLYREPMGQAVAAAASFSFYHPMWDSTYDLYVTQVDLLMLISGTVSGTQYWTAQLARVDGSNAATNIGSLQSMVSLTAGIWYRLPIVLNAVYTQSAVSLFQTIFSKVSTAGNLYADAAIRFRLVGV